MQLVFEEGEQSGRGRTDRDEDQLFDAASYPTPDPASLSHACSPAAIIAPAEISALWTARTGVWWPRPESRQPEWSFQGSTIGQLPGRIHNRRFGTISHEHASTNAFSRFELQLGDILISLDRPIISTGVKVARVRDEDPPCLLLQRVARAQFRSDAVLPEYFYRWLRSPHFINAIDPGRSNGVPHISHKSIEKLSFAAPATAEQRRIVAELDALQPHIDALTHLQTETAVELDALLPAILDRVFKGELV